MKKIELKNIIRVRFNDYTEYNSEKCSNGGAYGFWTDYSRTEDGKWEVSYGTTADMPWCPCCGDFSDHSPEECGGPKIVTTENLIKTIEDFEESEGEYIEYKEV